MISELFDFLGGICELVDDVRFVKRQVGKDIAWLRSGSDKKAPPLGTAAATSEFFTQKKPVIPSGGEQ